jgi:hypothetical protein
LADTLALFDFDGTLTFGDTYTPFIRACVGRLRLAVGACALSPFIVAYELGLVGGSPLRVALARLCFSAGARTR